MSEDHDPTNTLAGAREIFRLNLIKADPILRLLMAHRGFGDGQAPFLDAWSVFKIYLQLPASSEDGGGTFQASMAESNPHVLEVFFGRQLSERYGTIEPVSLFASIALPHLVGPPAETPMVATRIVGLSYVYNPPDESHDDLGSLDLGEEIWSADHSSLQEFFQTVERSAAFREACTRVPMAVNFYTQEFDGEDDGARP